MLDYSSIGRKIAYYRKLAYYKQATLAETLDISESYMSQIECGKAEVSLKRLSQIADTLKIDITVLLSDTNPQSESYGCSELIEVVRHWTPAQKEFLLNLVKCADSQIGPTKKEK